VPTLAELYEPFANAPVFCAGQQVGLTDKGTIHSYISIYETLLLPYRNVPDLHLLEIGIAQGYSLVLWSQYFSNAQIDGVDIRPELIAPEIYGLDRISIFIGDATTEDFVARNLNSYDVIIDDGSHQAKDQIQSFHLLYPRLRPGGLYVIEDLDRQESIDRIREELGAEIFDLRQNKGRFDDVLAVIRKAPTNDDR